MGKAGATTASSPDKKRELFLTEAAQRKPGDEMTISIRDLLSYWEAMRRGTWVIERIRHELREHGLTTLPAFENGWIDNTVVLVRSSAASTGDGGTTTADVNVEEVGPTAQVTSSAALRFADLPPANTELKSVKREHTILQAQSLMIQNDYSQLAVLSGREPVGAVSWESISRARMHNPNATLKDATVPATIVSLDDEVLPHVSDIVRRGFVFVRDRERKPSGIVTTTDLSIAFERLAGPFLLVGDVERRLRRVITNTFTLDEMRAVHAPTDGARAIDSVENMNVGEYIWLLDHPDRWSKLGWEVDRQTFVESLHAFRSLRNEVMHFSPDPLEESKLAMVRNLLTWLRIAVPEMT